MTMGTLKYIITPVILSIAFFLIATEVNSCNEALCGSVVSKCLLTKSCSCELSNCTCCKECFNCLSYWFSECCSCVEMCPKPNDTKPELETNSNVGDFREGVPALFNVLTEMPDPLQRWDAKSFPLDIEYNHYGPKKEIKIKMQSAEQEVAPVKQDLTLNCTVAFWAQCMSWKKCVTSCQTMGASSYRWFHDGCCQCIGQYCIMYGINESRCSACSQGGKVENTEEDSEDYLDYGEGDDDVDYSE